MKKSIYFQKSRIKGVEIKRCSNTEHSFKEHLHREISMGYIEKGSTEVSFNGKRYIFTENEAIIIPPYVTHICQPENIESWQFIMVYIDASYYFGEILEFEPRKLSDDETKKFLEFVRLLNGKYSGFAEENALVELIIDCSNITDKSNSFKNTKNIQKIYKYIMKNYLDNITLDKLESIFKINKFSIIRGFKSLYNTTPSSFQLQLKVAYSKELLGKGFDLLEVSTEAGFYDQAHFTKEFKKAYGITPLKYKLDIVNIN